MSFRTTRCFRPAIVVGAALSVVCSCASDQAVQRKRGESTVAGRSIPPAAYSWYQRGLHHERLDERSAAKNAFERTLDLDPESGSAWAALGRVVCKDSYKDALRIFERGLKSALRLGPIYVERGQCRLNQNGDRTLASALNDGESALALEPDNPKTTALVATALERLNRKKEAQRHTRAAAIREGRTPPRAPPDGLAAIDRAIFRNDLRTAQSRAQTLMTPGELSIRALAWGKLDLARKQARLVHQAAPSDQDAALALLLLGEHSSLDAGASPPSKLALLLFSLHLGRRVGPSAAAHFQTAWQLRAEASDDPVWNALVPAPRSLKKF